MKNFKYLFLFIILTMLPVNADGKAINRNILAMVDYNEVKGRSDDFLHVYAELPLNHLGFIVTYADANKKLPSDDEMKKYYGIVTWFRDNQLDNAEEYAAWTTRQLNHGKKLLIIDEVGFDLGKDNNPIPQKILDDFYKAFQITYNPDYSTSSPLLIEIAHNQPDITEFERSLTGDIIYFENIISTDKNTRTFLKLKRRDMNVYGDAVFINSRGGFVLGGYDLYYNPYDYQTKWRIDPFKFFAMAFDADFPRPDVSTINGMRLFYSHIDGDGIRNISKTDNKTPSGKLAYELIFTQYNLPVSVSTVVGDIFLERGESQKKLIHEIKEVYKLPNIQPASHGWAHPLVWKKEGRKIAYKLDDYNYSPQHEIGDAIKYINENLVPKGKETNIFFWTGDCMPDYEALKYVYDHGILNINGGDSRFDNEFPSYTYVAPLFRYVNGLRQYYASNSNENTYTNLWTGPFYGFIYSIQTFEHTESPMRIRPIDVYYHFYTMEHEVAIDAIREVYDWSQKQEITPVFVSDYVEIAKGFLEIKIEEAAKNHWMIKNNGELKAIRFDNNASNVDMSKSRGVLGFNHYQNSLYVHLENGDSSEIYLNAAKPDRVYLKKANGRIDNWSSTGSGLEFRLQTIGTMHLELAGLPKNTTIPVQIDNKIYNIKTDSEGVLSYIHTINLSPFKWINIINVNKRDGNRFKWHKIVVSYKL